MKRKGGTEVLLDRRMFTLTGFAGLGFGLAACTEESASLAVSAQGLSGMNPGPDGSDRPVTVQVIQMSGTGAFDSADYFGLQDPSSALGGEFVKNDQIVLAPGGSASKVIPLDPRTTAIGVTAGFRDPAGKRVRSKIPVPASDSGLMISVGSGGISLASA